MVHIPRVLFGDNVQGSLELQTAESENIGYGREGKEHGEREKRVEREEAMSRGGGRKDRISEEKRERRREEGGEKGKREKEGGRDRREGGRDRREGGRDRREGGRDS